LIDDKVFRMNYCEWYKLTGTKNKYVK